MWDIQLQGFPPLQGGDDIIPDVAEIVNNAGSVPFAVQVSAIISLIISFALLFFLSEWRRARSESAFRKAQEEFRKDLEKAKNDAEDKAKKRDDDYEAERARRRELEDTIDMIRRELGNVKQYQGKYTELIQKILDLKANGGSLEDLDDTIPFPKAMLDKLAAEQNLTSEDTKSEPDNVDELPNPYPSEGNPVESIGDNPEQPSV